jgi:hypothetical protein
MDGNVEQADGAETHQDGRSQDTSATAFVTIL